MPDFSQYQGPSPEWKRFLKANPIPAPDLSLSPQVIRQATNAVRIRMAEDELAEEGINT